MFSTLKSSSLSSKMQKQIDTLSQSLSQIRLGKPNTSILDKVIIQQEGKKILLNKIAQIQLKDSNSLLLILPDEQVSLLAEKAIRTADLGLNPIRIDSTNLKVPLPKLTNDGKLKVLKTIKDDCEKFRVSLRRLRQDARKDLQGMKKTMSADEFRKSEKEVDSMTDLFVKKVDLLYVQKEKEIKSN